jgi:hypothetical protein
MGQNGKLDHDIVELLKEDLSAVNQVRIAAQDSSREEYKKFLTEIGD